MPAEFTQSVSGCPTPDLVLPIFSPSLAGANPHPGAQRRGSSLTLTSHTHFSAEAQLPYLSKQLSNLALPSTAAATTLAQRPPSAPAHLSWTPQEPPRWPPRSSSSTQRPQAGQRQPDRASSQVRTAQWLPAARKTKSYHGLPSMREPPLPPPLLSPLWKVRAAFVRSPEDPPAPSLVGVPFAHAVPSVPSFPASPGLLLITLRISGLVLPLQELSLTFLTRGHPPIALIIVIILCLSE